MTGTTEGMVGGGYYDAHSTFQAAVAESGKTLLQNAVAALSLTASGEATIADYGCSEGRNSMATIAPLELLAGRGVAGFGVLHNDLPTNDWLSLAKNLSSPDSYLARFPQARALFAPRGFFERVTLPSSVTLGTSGSAVHWLSRQPPDLDMPRSLYRSDAPASELAKILKQAAADWRAFLEARAEELQPGGVLLVQMLGSDGSSNPVRVSAAGLLKLMNECALQLVDPANCLRMSIRAIVFRWCRALSRKPGRRSSVYWQTGWSFCIAGLRRCHRRIRLRWKRPATSRPSRKIIPLSPAPLAKAACARACSSLARAMPVGLLIDSTH